MSVEEITPATILLKMDLLCLHLLENKDYYSSIQAEKIKQDLEIYFDMKTVEKIKTSGNTDLN